MYPEIQNLSCMKCYNNRKHLLHPVSFSRISGCVYFFDSYYNFSQVTFINIYAI